MILGYCLMAHDTQQQFPIINITMSQLWQLCHEALKQNTLNNDRCRLVLWLNNSRYDICMQLMID